MSDDFNYDRRGTPAYLQVDWLERRVKELEEENELLKDGAERMALKGIEMREEIDRLKADLAQQIKFRKLGY